MLQENVHLKQVRAAENERLKEHLEQQQQDESETAARAAKEIGEWRSSCDAMYAMMSRTQTHHH